MESKGCSIIDWMQQSSCKVIVNESNAEGTGWLCSGCGHIITAGHLFVEDKQTLNAYVKVNVKVQFIGYNPVVANVLIAQRDDEKAIDYAVLKIEELYDGMLPLHIDTSLNLEGSVKICGFGNIFDNVLTPADGIIEGKAVSMDGETYWLKLNAQNAVQQGYSGGAVISLKSNAVIGIQTDASTKEIGADSNTTFAMPIGRILKLYPQLKEHVIITYCKFSIYEMRKQVITYRNLRQKDNELFFEERIDTRILPTTLDVEQEKPALNQAILDSLLKMKDRSCFILGEEGGCGKTVALLKFFNMKLSEISSEDVPIYIELKNIPEDLQKSNPLSHGNIFARYIASEYFEMGVFEDITNEQIRIILNELRNPASPKSRYILLIDGLNEVPMSSRSVICNEILYWENFNHIRMIVTSRYYEDSLIFERKLTSHDFYGEDDDIVESKKLKLLKIQELNENIVFEYLNSCGFTENVLNQVRKTQSLLKILRIPMFLIFFSRLTVNNFKSGISMICTRGEILAAFFSRKKDDMKKDILKFVNQNINQHMRLVKKDELTLSRPRLKQQYFILDIIIPYIAFYLVKNQRYFIEREEMIQMLSILFKNDSYMMQRGRRIEKYRILRDILIDWSKGNSIYQIDDCVDSIIDFITKELCVMKKVRNLHVEMYEFLHEHLRDYFAAMQLREDMGCYVIDGQEGFSTLAFQNIPQVVLEFFGEICGEHNCKPICDEDAHCWKYPGDSYILNIMQNLRGKHDTKSQIIISNIIKTLKYARNNDLSGLDFSNLDFSQSWLGGIRFYRWYNDIYYTSCFDGSTIQARNLLHLGHSCRITTILLNEKNLNVLYSADILGYVKIWDLSTKNCETIKVAKEAIRDILLDEKRQLLYIASVHHFYSMSLVDYSIKMIKYTDEYICKIGFHIDGQLVYCNDLDLLCWYLLDGSAVSESYPISIPSAAACITKDKMTILMSGKSKANRVLLYHFDESTQKWPDSANFSQGILNGKRVNSMCLSKDEKRLLVTIGNYLYEFSIEKNNELQEMMQLKSKNGCSYAVYSYDKDGNRNGIIYTDGYSIKMIDCNKELIWTLFQGDSENIFSIPFIAKKDYSAISLIKSVEIRERYLIVTNNYVQEFDAVNNICDKIYPRKGACILGYCLNTNKMYLFTNTRHMFSFENGMEFNMPLVNYRLYDSLQMKESVSFSILNLGNKAVIFDRDNGTYDEFQVYDGLMIQHCSMRHIKGEMAGAHFQQILKRYGAKIGGDTNDYFGFSYLQDK